MSDDTIPMSVLAGLAPFSFLGMVAIVWILRKVFCPRCCGQTQSERNDEEHARLLSELIIERYQESTRQRHL